MSSGFIWTVVGSVAAVVAAAIAFLQWVLPAITQRRHSRPVVSGRRWWPRSRPQVANTRPRRTPRFTGRGALLAELRQAARTNRPVVLYGLGGVGKTQLALEYSEREQRRFDVVWWVHAEQRATVESDLVALARALRLPEHADPDQERVLAAVRDWLDRHHRWLLVLDNAENDEVLGWVLPSEPRGRILVTSRNQLWRDAIVVWVRPWTPVESLAFLRVSLAPVPTARFNTAVAQDLAAELGHLPIALEQAVAFVRAVARPLTDYLTVLRARPQELFDLSDLPDDARTVGRTWAAALEKVQATLGAAELLALCAFMAADDIPRDLVHDSAEKLAEPLAMVAADQVALGRAVITLRRFSFVDATQQTLTVHRLVQAVVRHRLGDDGRRQWAASAVRLVDASFPMDSNDVRTWPVCEVLLPHALMASGHAEQLGVEPNTTGRLLNHAAMYLLGRARLAESKSVLRRALAIAEVTLGPDHVDVATCRSNLGVVLRDLGDLAGARVQFERAAAIAEAALGPDHPNVATVRSNLGDALHALGDLADARTQFERALAID
jgi:Tetratricopeptide repeat/NB-ARC domain